MEDLITIQTRDGGTFLVDGKWPEHASISALLVPDSVEVRPRPSGHLTIRLANGMAVYRIDEHHRPTATYRTTLVYSEGPF